MLVYKCRQKKFEQSTAHNVHHVSALWYLPLCLNRLGVTGGRFKVIALSELSYRKRLEFYGKVGRKVLLWMGLAPAIHIDKLSGEAF